VRLHDVRLEHVPGQVPPLSLGVRGAKSLALSGRCADGTILAENAAPAYVAWARERIDEGRRDAGRTQPHRLTIYALCAVSETDPDGARATVRRATADMIGDGHATAQTAPLLFAAELDSLIAQGGADALFRQMPDAWLDDLTITGRPEDGAAAIERLRTAGADAVVLVPPVEADPDVWLDDVESTLLPLARES
jgi:5,10-methylenetetrahydromethanopterin reductase